MSRYYCPYCLPCYQFQKQRADGVMICGQCGDPLVKSPLIKPTQILAFITVIAFISPLIIIVFSYINEIDRNKNPNINNLVEIQSIKE